MAGFIYIMSNPAFSTGLVKIGKSDRDPELHRKFELETTGVPSPFYVEYYAFVSDHHSLERQLHHKYAKFRLNHSREFFHVPIAELIIEIRSSGNVIHEKVNFKSPEEIKKAQIEKEKLASQAIAKKQREKDDNERRKKEEQLEVKRQEAIEKTHEIINTHANSYKWMNFHIRPENKFAIIFAFILSAILTASAGPIGIFLLICILFGLSPQLVLDLLYDNKAYALGILLEENNFRSIHEHVLSGRDPSDIIRRFLYKNHQQIKSELRAQAQVASSNNKFTLPERDREKNYQQTEKLRNNNHVISFKDK